MNPMTEKENLLFDAVKDHDIVAVLMARAWKNLTYEEKISADWVLLRMKRQIRILEEMN